VTLVLNSQTSNELVRYNGNSYNRVTGVGVLEGQVW